MILVNKLTEPGHIKWLGIYPDSIKVETVGGEWLVYRRVLETGHVSSSSLPLIAREGTGHD